MQYPRKPFGMRGDEVYPSILSSTNSKIIWIHTYSKIWLGPVCCIHLWLFHLSPNNFLLLFLHSLSYPGHFFYLFFSVCVCVGGLPVYNEYSCHTLSSTNRVIFFLALRKPDYPYQLLYQLNYKQLIYITWLSRRKREESLT